ncbi:hypothetical protein ACFZBP_10925 [Streptomyces sp. NPDC008086]|uniref:hypothetical protein n=1 Tax=unclassified Streptomyces TaxID=2593676 RepID=UPI0036B6249F
MTTPEPDGVVVDDWILDTNLRALCESVAAFVDYDFDDSDWQAVETALPTTDVERSVWYDYPLMGRVPLTLYVADDPGSSVVFVRFAGQPDSRTVARIEAALHIFTFWEVRRGPGHLPGS